MNPIKENEAMKQEKSILEKNPKKRMGKWLILLLVLVVAILIGLYLGFQKLTINPLNVYKTAINDTYNTIDQYLKENTNSNFDVALYEEPWTLDANFTVQTDLEDLDFLNQYQYQIALGSDYSQEQVNLDLGINDEEEEIFDIFISYLNNKAYLKSDALFQQVLDIGEIDLNLDLESLSTSELMITYDDIHLILENMKNIFIDSLDQDMFESTSKEIELEGKNVQVTSYTYLLDEQNLERTMEYFKERINSNEELLDVYSRITGMNIDELKSSINDIAIQNSGEIKINLYTESGSHVIAGNITLDEEIIMNFTNQSQGFEIMLFAPHANLEVVFKEDTLTMSYYEGNKEIIMIAFTLQRDSKKIQVQLNQNSEEYQVNLEFSNIKDQEDSYQADFIFDLYLHNSSVQTNINLDGTLNISVGKLESLDYTNSVDINSLSEEEQLDIMENLSSILERLELM